MSKVASQKKPLQRGIAPFDGSVNRVAKLIE